MRGYTADTLKVPARAAAVKAGLGLIGKNTLFYANGVDSYVGIAVIGTDLELESPKTVFPEKVSTDHCVNCGKCIDACPTGAIHMDGYRIHPQKCISFLNRHADELG